MPSALGRKKSSEDSSRLNGVEGVIPSMACASYWTVTV
jgi:hypothetical protein